MDEQFDPQARRWRVWTAPVFMLSLLVVFCLFPGWFVALAARLKRVAGKYWPLTYA